MKKRVKNYINKNWDGNVDMRFNLYVTEKSWGDDSLNVVKHELDYTDVDFLPIFDDAVKVVLELDNGDLSNEHLITKTFK